MKLDTMKKEANCELDRLMMFIWGLRPMRNNRVVKQQWLELALPHSLRPMKNNRVVKLDWSVVSLRPMRNYRVVKHKQTLTLRYKKYKNKKDMGNSVKRR